LYAQVAGSSILEILKLKKNYSNLLAQKIKNIQKIIISMDKENADKFMISASNYIANINKALKSIKSDIIADYIQKELIGITIIINKVGSSSDIQVIENFVKNMENINFEDIELLRLPQSKSYLKIIDFPYFIENSNIHILLNFVETIIKSNYVFNNLLLVSKL